MKQNTVKISKDMTRIGVSRRKALEAGACALVGAAGLSIAASARAGTGPSTTTEEIIRKWYKAWEKKDEGQFEALMTDNFTFTSAAGDDHISKSTFKTQCWDTQAKLIERSDLERVIASGNEAFVKYLCHTTNGKSFRNVEYLRIREGKVEAIECYFGGAGYPSAASKGM
jgi:ketosteroid isomerase-like protein